MITVHKQLTDVTPRTRGFLRRLCFRDGVMGDILDTFECGTQVRTHRYVVILWSSVTPSVPLSWALIDDASEAHVYTSAKHRKHGYGPKMIAVLLSALPKKKSKALRWADSNAKDVFCIGQYLYLNALTPKWHWVTAR